MLGNAFQSAPELTGFILLLVLIGFVVVVGAAGAMVGRAGWSLLATLNRTQKSVITPAVELMERAEKTAERADRLGLKAQELDGTVARLRMNMVALAVLTETMQKASHPLLRARTFFKK